MEHNETRFDCRSSQLSSNLSKGVLPLEKETLCTVWMRLLPVFIQLENALHWEGSRALCTLLLAPSLKPRNPGFQFWWSGERSEYVNWERVTVRILGEMGSEGWLDRGKVHVAMILGGAGYGGYNVLTKVTLSGGVDPFVFSTYRDGIGCITLFLYALYYERWDDTLGCFVIRRSHAAMTSFPQCLLKCRVLFFLRGK